jgi:hypothetical protein
LPDRRILQGDTIGFVGGQVFGPVLLQRILRRVLVGKTGFLVAPENDGTGPGSDTARPDLERGQAAAYRRGRDRANCNHPSHHYCRNQKEHQFAHEGLLCVFSARRWAALRLDRGRPAYPNLTTSLSEWLQFGHLKVRLSCPGVAGSMRASIIDVPHFGQGGRTIAREDACVENNGTTALLAG